MLKIRFKDNKYNAVWLVEPKITIGRAATNALVVEDPDVADVHVEVLVDNENLTLKNLVPSTPVSVNELEISASCELKPDDVIRIGSVELLVVDPKRESRVPPQESANATQLRPSKPTGWSLKANHAALANRVFPLRELTVIGRAGECDISLAAAHLSRRHAQLQVVDGMLYVKDLGSANGTFLNGKQITEGRVKRGDELRFDTLSFGVLGPSDDMAKTTVRKMPRADERPETSAKGERERALEVKARAAARAMAVPATRASSGAAGENASQGAPNEPGSKGRFGLILIGVLAVVVITTLILTRN